MKIYIDGQFYDRENAKISVFDHGLLYGDGVFEGIRAYNGRVFRLEQHIDRLFDSAKAILLTIPLSKEEMSKAVVETCRQSNLPEGYIRLVVTRGVGNLGLSPDRCPKASVIIIASSLELYPEKYYTEGLTVVTAGTTRMPPNTVNPAIKSLNYLNNIMAKIEGGLAGAQEVLMLNSEGYAAECSGDNIFVLKGGTLYTPPVYAGALVGITRAVVIEMAEKAKLPFKEMPLTRYDLFVADEFFLTGTGAEIIPVVKLDGRSIGDGKPGVQTKRFIEEYSKITRSTGTPIF